MKLHSMRKIFVMMLVLYCLFGSSSCSTGHNKTEASNVYGNTVCNLRNGGGVAKQGNNLFVVTSEKTTNKIVIYDQPTQKINCLKTFLLTPSELSIYDKYLFYKKNAGMFGDSGLYRMDTKTKGEKKIISEVVDKYLIYENNIYYTLRSRSNDKPEGLYRCDIDGRHEVLLISETVSEFVVTEKSVYYVAENKIKHYDIHNEKAAGVICEEEGMGYYDLSVCAGNLYFVACNAGDALGETVCKYDTASEETTSVLTSAKASIRFAGNNLLLFENEDGLYRFDSDKSAATLFLDKFAIDEVYVFDMDVYFFVTTIDGTKELWQTDLSGSLPQKIL